LTARAPICYSMWFAASAFISTGDKRTTRRSYSFADFANAQNLRVIPEGRSSPSMASRHSWRHAFTHQWPSWTVAHLNAHQAALI